LIIEIIIINSSIVRKSGIHFKNEEERLDQLLLSLSNPTEEQVIVRNNNK
jgi:hypothetical protein